MQQLHCRKRHSNTSVTACSYKNGNHGWLAVLAYIFLHLAVAATAEPATLIVEYQPSAVSSAAAAAAMSGSAAAASSSAVATAAIAAAAARGATAAKQAHVAALASQAATANPGLDALTTSISIAAASSGVNVVSQTTYSTVLQGAAIKTRSGADAHRLKQQLEQNPAIKKVWYAGARKLVKPIKAEMAQTAQAAAATPEQQTLTTPSTATSGNAVATGLQAARNAHNGSLTGSGILICVVDTGINYKQTIFGNCTGLNQPQGQCRVVTGYNFVGDAYTGQLDGPAAQPGGEPVDCMGHGTMVASVAATSNGVAPGALLGSYRVFGCSGYAIDDVIIEAVDKAVQDGCDVINLSLASGSGYADSSVYSTVMDNAMKKGVLVVKAAGNSGFDGPFTADVFTAVGSIAAASVGEDKPVDVQLVPSSFSSYGPAPTLDLAPTVAAPGGNVPVISMYGYKSRASGTSFSSPYISGVLALWLQSKQVAAAAAARGVSVPVTLVQVEQTYQAAAMQGLVATAKGVQSSTQGFLQPLAKTGAGLIQVDAFLRNQLVASPHMLQLPSALVAAFTKTITVRWEGPPTAADAVTYDVQHLPAASMTLGNGWYGTDASIKYVYKAARVSFNQQSITVSTDSRQPIQLQVTFKLPAVLTKQPLLYSGQICLQPRSTSLPAVIVPYQGFSEAWPGSVGILAKPRPALDTTAANELRAKQNALCYAPNSQPVIVNAIMDMLAVVPDVCSGGMAKSFNDTLDVSLQVLQSSPKCSLRITLVPEIPLHTLIVNVLSADGTTVLGSINPLDTSDGNSLATAGQVWSFCLRFDGSYKDQAGRVQALQVGKAYRLRASLQGPVAAGDAALGLKPKKLPVAIRGSFKVTQ